MAYSFTATTTVRRGGDGRLTYHVSVSEVDAGPASEWSVAGLPAVWTMVSYVALLTGGAGATIQPAIGNAPAFASGTMAYIAGQIKAAASVNDQTSVVGRGAATLYGHSTVDAGANNAISTEIVLVEGGQ